MPSKGHKLADKGFFHKEEEEEGWQRITSILRPDIPKNSVDSTEPHTNTQTHRHTDIATNRMNRLGSKSVKIHREVFGCTLCKC